MRTKKAILNIIFSGINRAVVILCGLVIPRLVLRKFGSEYNGVINSANQFLRFISVLSIGIAGPTRVALYSSLANNDKYKTAGIMKATDNYMRKVALAIIIYAGFLMMVYPFISHSSLQNWEISLLIGITAITLCVEYFFCIANQNLLIADQKEYIYNCVSTVVVLLNAVITIIFIRQDFSIFAVKLGGAFVYLIIPITLGIYVKKKYSFPRKCRADYSAIWQRKAAAATSVANIVHENTDLIVLTVLTDIKFVSVYSVYAMVITQLRNVMFIFTGNLEAGFGNVIARKEDETLKRNFRLYEYFIYAFVSVVFSCVFLLILPFVECYTEGVTDADYIVPVFAMLVTLAEYLYCIRQPYVTLVQAAGKYEDMKIGAVIEAILNITASVVFVLIMGLPGVMIGTIIANTFRSVQYMLFVYDKLLIEKKDRMVRWFIWSMGNVLAIIAITVSIYCTVSFPSGWTGWTIQALITFLTAVIVTTFSSFVFCRKEVKLIIQITKIIIKRRN